MKILVVSDTHRLHKNLEKALNMEGPVDMMIHLGDVEGGEYYIEKIAGCPVRMIAGNNDFFTDLPREEEFELKGKRIWTTHGHSYYVSIGEERLKEAARKKGVDIVMYGHTHRPSVSRTNDLLMINPGSLSYPRQEGRRGSFIIMELNENQDVQVEIKYV